MPSSRTSVHLGLMDALLEELGGLQAAVLEGVAVPAAGGRSAITDRHGLMLPPQQPHVTLDRKDLFNGCKPEWREGVSDQR
jgi:hypothetical protein